MKFLLEQTELEGDLEYSVILVPCGSQPGFYPELHADTVYVPERVFGESSGLATPTICNFHITFRATALIAGFTGGHAALGHQRT